MYLNTTHITMCPLNAAGRQIIITIPVSMYKGMGEPRYVFVNEPGMRLQPATDLQSQGRTVKPLNKTKSLCFTPIYKTVEYYAGKWAFEYDGEDIVLTHKISN